jgi:hypothetical protein
VDDARAAWVGIDNPRGAVGRSLNWESALLPVGASAETTTGGKKMRRIIFRALPFILMVILLSGLLACGKAEPSVPATNQPTTSVTTEPVATETGEPDYAGVATDVTLQGLSEDDLEKYTRYADDQFKDAVIQQILDATSKQINSQLGAYESIEFVSVETQDEYTVVHYKAKYAKGEVGVRMVFDADHLVAGQWFE